MKPYLLMAALSAIVIFDVIVIGAIILSAPHPRDDD